MGEPRELQQQSVPPQNDAQLFPQHEGPSTEAGFGAEALQSLELLAERMRRVLKYSAMPGLSRHHQPLGKWLEANRDVLPLKTTYSGKREGGYQDEPWHLSMGVLGPGLHARFDAQMDIETDVIPSIVDAFNVWSKSASKLPKRDIDTNRGGLGNALGKLGLRAHVDSVNPDIKPGPGQ